MTFFIIYPKNIYFFSNLITVQYFVTKQHKQYQTQKHTMPGILQNADGSCMNRRQIMNSCKSKTQNPDDPDAGDFPALSWWDWCCPGLPRKFCCGVFTLIMLVMAVGSVALLSSSPSSRTNPGGLDWALSIVQYGMLAVAFLGTLMLMLCPPSWFTVCGNRSASNNYGGGGDIRTENLGV